MKKLLLLFFLLYCHNNLWTQCVCTDCPITILSNTSETSVMNISGSTNPTLGVNGQALCQVCVNFDTDAIKEINFTLTAPDGSSVLLMEHDGINVNANMVFDICFVTCSAVAVPEPGHQQIFHTDDGWPLNSSFGGTYYPIIGCLEDFTGSVNGNWELKIQDFIVFDDSVLNDWYLVFADDSGLNCTHASECDILCLAEAGDIIIDNSPACPGEEITFSVQNYNATSEFDEYLLIINDLDEIVKIIHGDNGAYIYDDCGELMVYSYNFELSGSSTIPSLGDLITNYDCVSNCCDLESLVIVYEDNIPPTWTFLPPHPNFSNGNPLMIFCIEDVPPPDQATYDDNCIDPGAVDPTDIDNTDPCNGGTILRTWEIEDSCNTANETYVITIEPKPLATFLNTPPDITVDCGNIPSNAPDLFYSNGFANSCASDGSASAVLTENYDACGGSAQFTWTAIDECNRTITYNQIITVNAADVPIFINPPLDMVITCDAIPSTGPSLSVSNNLTGSCLIDDIVNATITNNYNNCSGEILLEWNYTDPCGRSIVNIQTLTVAPSPVASFINPPGDIVVDCNDVSSIPLVLSYTNNEMGACAISGDIVATQIGDYTACGGNISYLWEFTDGCGRMISHTQIITINPANDIYYINPPNDITLDCGQDTYTPAPLEYTNGEMGNCLTAGFVIPSTTQLGNQIFVDWTLDLPCNNSFLSHIQTITILETPITIIDPTEIYLCLGEGYNLEDINITDFNNTGASVSYYDDISLTTPLTDTYVSPNITTDYYIVLTTDDGCINFAIFTVFIEYTLTLAIDGNGAVCNDETLNNLFSFLNNVSNTNGVWIDTDGSGINISNPTSVNFNGVLPGQYQFQYYVPSTNSCPSDTAVATINVLEGLDIEILSVNCSIDLSSYTINISINTESTININSGNIIDNGSGNYSISNIPIDTILNLTATDNITNCSDEINISPPDCSCPTVNSPLWITDYTACTHELSVTMSVSVDLNQSATWYDSSIGGTILIANSVSYISSDTLTPGIYIFYAETIDLTNPGCTSLTRTPVTLTVLDSPIVNQIVLKECISYMDNWTRFNLPSANTMITDNSTHTVRYFATKEDATMLQDELPDTFILTQTSDLIIYARVEAITGCYSIEGLTLHPLPYPETEFELADEACFEQSNGIIELLQFNSDFVDTAIDTPPYTDSISYHNLSSGNHTLLLIDSFGCENRLDFDIQEGILISTTIFSVDCSDNDTQTILDDDFYTISFSFSNNQNSIEYQLFLDSNLNATYRYDSTYSIVISADSISHLLKIIDVDSGCENQSALQTIIFVPCSIECNEFPDASIFVDPSNVLDCSVKKVSLSSKGEDDIAYQWIFNNNILTESELNISEEGQVILIAIDTTTGCQSQDTLDIIDLEAYPLVSILQPDTLSCDNDFVTLDGSSSTSGSQYDINWYFESINNNINNSSSILTVQESGWYFLEVIDTILGCVNIDSVFVVNISNYPEIDVDNVILGDCGEETFNLSASISNTTQENITWSTTQGLISSPVDELSIEAIGSGIYYINVYDETSHCKTLDSIEVITRPIPEISSLNIIDEQCYGQEDGKLFIEPIDNNNLPFVYEINNQIYQLNNISDLSPGNYSVAITDNNGCKLDTFFQVEEAIEWHVSLDSFIDYTFGEDNVLNATIDIDLAQVDRIEWSPSDYLSCDDCLSTILYDPSFTSYQIIVTDIYGCESIAHIEINFDESIDISVPNVFNPGGYDDINYFHISVSNQIQLNSLELNIYSRWGELIYHNDQLLNAMKTDFWDGTYKGKQLNPGVYIYHYTATLKNGKSLNGVGDITIIK